MKALLRRCFLLLILAGFTTRAGADPSDLAAAARSVVRVALVTTDGTDAYFVGHGSGIAVAPDKVLTNAHVVELTRQEKNIVIGVIPSQGKKSYGGKVVAYSPGNDLALIQLEQGSLPVATFFAGAVTDGQHVTAIGYPGAVDRAQGLGMAQMIEPLAPVKTGGNISSGRSAKNFDTILHTAPLASGNSGGPLVDDCGRILGINSFGSLSDGSDAEFGFAVSNREIASFLRQAGINFQRTNAPCKSIDELNAEDAKLTAQQNAALDAAARQRQAAWQQAESKARDTAERDVITARENVMALAAVLLALAVMAGGAAGLTYNQGRHRHAMWFGIGGGALLIAAGAAFFLRPGFASVDERVSDAMQDFQGNSTDAVSAATYDATGNNLCRIDENRSRITVSDTQDVEVNWDGKGCVNGKTLYGRDGESWSRTLVPDGEPTISISHFDPSTGSYRTDRYFVDSDTADAARAIRKKYDVLQCSGAADAGEKLGRMQTEVRQLLPGQPNERLVYQCSKAVPKTGE